VKLLEYPRRFSRGTLLLFALFLVILIAGADYASGSEISVSALYLAPIGLVVWYVGRRAGIAFSLLSAAGWLLADSSSLRAYAHPLIPYWNTLVGLAFFLTVTYALSALRSAYHRLRALHALRDDMTHMLVHDLKSPLVPAEMALEQIRRACASPPADAERVDEMLDIIAESHQRMERLIADILDVARAESGQMPLTLASEEVASVVRDAVSEVSPWADGAEQTIEQTYPSEPMTATVDAEKIRRVVDNLLTNAIRFTPPGGRLRVSVKRQDREAWVTVRDDGQGIPEDLRDRIFDKYVQAATHTRRRLSVGLGLTFCKMVVEAHGGRIWADSTEGRGSAFTFTLPLQDGLDAAAQPPPPPSAPAA
jgi:signal transduction histidine kinase